MTRINALRKITQSRDSVAWGKDIRILRDNLWGNINALAFAAVLIICSVAVGCSSDKPKPAASNNQTPVTQPQPQPVSAPMTQPESKPAPKKPVQHKKPATVNYTDKTYGLTFEYPRRYAIETGDAAADVVLSHPVPMNFVQPGGVALAAVELPESSFANTDFSSAFFNVSVNKALTAEQCSEFAVPEPKSTVKTESPVPQSSSDMTKSAVKDEKQETAKQDSMPPQKSDSQAVSLQSASSTGPTSNAKSQVESNSRLVIGDLDLRATEAVSGEGPRQSDSKYFHVYQNGACYEFALNVTTIASEDGITKHVDRDKVFDRLEKILTTVKINPVAPEVTAENPTPTDQVTPAQ